MSIGNTSLEKLAKSFPFCPHECHVWTMDMCDVCERDYINDDLRYMCWIDFSQEGLQIGHDFCDKKEI